MARLLRREAEAVVPEERAWKCDSCPAMLEDQDKTYCRHCASYWEDVSNGLYDDAWTCPACKGRGTVNPLTAPDWFFCAGTTGCPVCDGTGEV